MAAGVAGTVGAQELKNYWDNNITSEEDKDKETDNNVIQTPEENHAVQPQHPTPANHQEIDEIQPVASIDEPTPIEVNEDNLDVIDVDPDEIAEAIIEEAEDPEEILLALNDDKDDESEEDEEIDEENDDIEDDIEDVIMNDIEDCLA